MLFLSPLRLIQNYTIMSKQRCLWCQGNDLYEKYHDLEWGVPEYNDQKLFEILSLEIFQAGLLY
jgi:DNA-3-methyladenine glycosylase I